MACVTLLTLLRGSLLFTATCSSRVSLNGSAHLFAAEVDGLVAGMPAQLSPNWHRHKSPVFLCRLRRRVLPQEAMLRAAALASIMPNRPQIGTDTNCPSFFAGSGGGSCRKFAMPRAVAHASVVPNSCCNACTTRNAVCVICIT